MAYMMADPHMQNFGGVLWIFSSSVSHVSKVASLIYLLLADNMSKNENFYLRYIQKIRESL